MVVVGSGCRRWNSLREKWRAFCLRLSFAGHLCRNRKLR